MPFGDFRRLALLLSLMARNRFCFIPNKARFLLDLEKRFFNEPRAGNGLLPFFLSFLSIKQVFLAPVIAIFTKFDDLISQIYDTGLEEDENREAAARILKDNLRGPLFDYQFPPRADVCLEGVFNILLLVSLSIF
jgi:hypothetical protein